MSSGTFRSLLEIHRVVVLVTTMIQSGWSRHPSPREHPGKILEVKGCGLPSLSGRIRGGDSAGGTQFPWIVAILRRGIVYCTGTLITARHVLTAGHCKLPIRKISVRYGSNGTLGGGDTVRVKAGQRHPSYDDGKHNEGRTSRDAWILTLARELEINSRVRPICLSEDVRIEPGMSVIIAGFGAVGNPLVESPSLKYTMSRILSPWSKECLELMGNAAHTELCVAKGLHSVCKGDSGGPAMRIVNGIYYQVGITSYGSGTPDCPHCACPEPFTPQAFARVDRISDFIKSVCD